MPNNENKKRNLHIQKISFKNSSGIRRNSAVYPNINVNISML